MVPTLSWICNIKINGNFIYIFYDFSCLYQQVVAVSPFEDTVALVACNHEEADTRMMVYAADTVKSEHRRILHRTVDTDVEVLAVWMAQELRAYMRQSMNYG